MAKPHVIILGAGPAGLGASFKLAQRAIARVTVLEQNPRVGGNAGSFDLGGMQVDFGSHRLHPACDPIVLQDIRALLGSDLLDRPRHGRIRLCGRWIHFPLRPLELAFDLPLSFSAGVGADLIRKFFGNGKRCRDEETFASVLEKGLGRTICSNFYFPYVQKIWGLRPEELATTLARRRISANSLTKMMQKVFGALSVSHSNGRGRFYYPRYGYGQISEAFYDAACRAGADVYLGSRVRSIETENGAVKTVYYERDGKTLALEADHVWSTIPITVLAKLVKPPAPTQILQAVASIHYRAMILIYLVLEQDRFSEFDAHYFPESNIPISRLSEPKNYSDGQGPGNFTVLCAELPCAPDSIDWGKSDDELGQLVCRALETAEIPVSTPIKRVVTRRLSQAYPIYEQGYKSYFDAVDSWLEQIHGLLTFGRQGLFAHDNTHHALYMAYSAVDCFQETGLLDTARWQTFRKIFETHVVED